METLSRVRALALEQVEVMDALELAIDADDAPRVLELARTLIDLEREVKRQ